MDYVLVQLMIDSCVDDLFFWGMVLQISTSFISHYNHGCCRSITLRISHFQAYKVLCKDTEVLDGVFCDMWTLDVDDCCVGIVEVPFSVAELVTQELPVKGGWMGRLPSQVDRVAAGVVS